MKKKIICILLIIAVISVCVVGLTGCDFSGITDLFKKEEQSQLEKTQENQGGSESNPSEITNPDQSELPKDDDQNTGDNANEDGGQNESSSTPDNLTIAGKSYVFENVVVYFVKSWSNATASEEDLLLTIPTDEEMNEYVNFLAAEYNGVRLSFENDGVMKMLYSDSREEQEYLYKQQSENIQIGYNEVVKKFGKEMKVWHTALTAKLLSEKELVLESVLYSNEKGSAMIIAELVFNLV